MWYRLIPAKWLKEQDSNVRPLEGEFNESQLKAYNLQGYNIYFFPNFSSFFEPTEESRYLTGDYIDTFNYVFVDMDLKEGKYASKDDFVTRVLGEELRPTSIIDSGNGVHAYWKVSDLDAMSFLRIQRRLARYLSTDLAVGKLNQLMRCPGTNNVKDKDNLKPCQVGFDNPVEYTSEQLDKFLPRISQEDEDYCQNHYNMTYEINDTNSKVTVELPLKFQRLCKENAEAKDLFYNKHKDRSSADYRLAHLMFNSKFNRDEARAVLFNTAKASTRSPKHRYAYAENIVSKVWIFEAEGESSGIARSVKDILKQNAGKDISNVRLYGHPMFDGTEHGFRLSEVIGLVGGTGIGKTTVCLNYFKWFVERNPNYIHVFVSLEQPENEIAIRWQTVCGDNVALHDKVHIIGNYDVDGNYRHLSLNDVQEHILKLEQDTQQKVGCVVIDHIGVLKREKKREERESIEGVCSSMKAFSKATNTLLIMQSQTSRAKSGIGDMELDKDAAYGTTSFEWYCDYLVTIWQPLKRVYTSAPNMTVVAFKFCKIRHKNVKKDRIKEDTIYAMLFELETETMRELTEDEYDAFDYWNRQATTLRNKDKKREPAPIQRLEMIDESIRGSGNKPGV